MSDTPRLPRTPVLLVILDGVGVNPSKAHNAVYLARTPCLDFWLSKNPHTTLEASGRAVGLPEGQMGNSEVGHLTLGCGSIVRQDLVRIDDAIADGSFFENPALLAAVRAAKAAERPLHLLGLVSDGGVHSHIAHLFAIIDLCGREDVRPVVHMITDGRDTAPSASLHYLPELERRLAAVSGLIATVSGRYYAMDRDRRWERTEEAWAAMVRGAGERFDTARQAIEAAWAAGETDEFIHPRVVNPEGLIRDGDTVLFFNFRNDRPRQMAKSLGQPEFKGFDRGAFRTVAVTTLTEYDPKLDWPICFPPERPAVTLAGLVSEQGLRQLHCAETEKYAHVTFFFNGGREEPFPGEDHVMVPSPKAATYDLQPEMSAREVADEVVQAIEGGEYAFIVVNFANGDMVGHTAIREAVIQAVEAMDREAGRVIEAAVNAGYSVVVTADHGNCDEMVDPVTGEPHTQHTTYPVPCLVIDRDSPRLTTGGGLSGIAPTVLQLMGIPQPRQMRGRSLLLS